MSEMTLPLQMLRLETPALHRCSSSLPLSKNRSHLHHHHYCTPSRPSAALVFSPKRPRVLVLVGKEETELRTSTTDDLENADPDDVELVRQIQRVLELLRKNRDMVFNEVKLTILIEDPREAERKRLLGIEVSNDVTRDDLVAALEDVNEGKIPENRVALRMLAEEMINWPNLEVEAPKTKPSKSLYAKATDTGVDLKAAAKRLNIDWDSAAEFEDDDENAEEVVPPAVGYGALYLVTLLPVIIGISVILILFYNSLQ